MLSPINTYLTVYTPNQTSLGQEVHRVLITETLRLPRQVVSLHLFLSKELVIMMPGGHQL